MEGLTLINPIQPIYACAFITRSGEINFGRSEILKHSRIESRIMATSTTSELIKLNGENYPAWKLQLRMALIRDDVWEIVNGTEKAPTGEGVTEDTRKKFKNRSNKALSMIVLSFKPALHYLVGREPDDPVAVWKLLANHFERKTWGNRYELWKRLFNMPKMREIRDGGSVNEHLKSLQEIFDSLAVLEDPVTENKQVMFILASLPESFQTMVTALAASAGDVPSLVDIKERIRSEELRQKQSIVTDDAGRKALAAATHSQGHHKRTGYSKRQLTCHFCNKPGHFKRDCRKWAAQKKKNEAASSDNRKQLASTANAESSSDSETIMMTTHALSSVSRGKWIVDSGATCHMCNDREQFVKFEQLSESQEVTLGDGHTLRGTGVGTVEIETLLPDGSTRKCKLQKVLYVPNLSYNLLSVSKAAETGNTTKFTGTGCDIIDRKRKVVAFATKVGNLYYLEYCRKEKVNVTDIENKERLWHRRYGHLGEQNLQKLSKTNMLEHFDYDTKKRIGFCEACVGGKHHRSPFEKKKRHTLSAEPLELVHSDVCGKIGEKSQGGAEYFLTFVDDHSRYAWVYPLKTKDQVFDRFVEWKTLVERSSGKKLKTLRSDNGGEFTSTRFESYLKKEGIHHEKTIPKTPEQNGVA